MDATNAAGEITAIKTNININIKQQHVKQQQNKKQEENGSHLACLSIDLKMNFSLTVVSLLSTLVVLAGCGNGVWPNSIIANFELFCIFFSQ